ncbi:MAG: hypothetical protein ACI9U2_002076 [Bradymonadia bacterium]|jgi:hypothetical protein
MTKFSNGGGWIACILLLIAACDDGGPAASIERATIDHSVPDLGPPPDATPRDAMGPDAMLPDAAPMDATVVDMADAMWLPPNPDLEPPPPAAWRVGTAIRRMRVPLGIGTTGFGFTQADAYSTPFQQAYPGTQRVHMHPDFRAVVFEAGAGNRLYLVRLDTIGVTANIRRALVARLEARYGPGIDDKLIVAASHTHSGPGRVIDKPLWRVIADPFFPEYHDRVVDDLEATVVEAVDGLEPAQVGYAVASTTDVHSDRRCANPEETDPDFPILKVANMVGETQALILFHTVHSTAVGMDQYSLSQDVSGGIEAKVAERFDDDVFVMFVNGAAADMRPGSPPFEREADVPEWPRDYEKCEAVGRAAADAVMSVVDTVDLKAEGVLHSRTARVPINRTALGYADGVFPFEHGAVYCGAGLEDRCLGEEPHANLLVGCIAFPDALNSAPTQAPLTVGQIGDLSFITTPGEFSVSLGRRAAEAMQAVTGQRTVVFGYAQEYTGYSLGEEDWRQGGYESSGALWGPRQGDYLADSIISLSHAYANPRLPLTFDDQPPLLVPATYDGAPWPTMRSPMPAVVTAEPAEQSARGDMVEFAFTGGDPWLGNPIVTLERQTDDGFEPVKLGARDVTTDGYLMTLLMAPDPAYVVSEAPGTSHTFNYTASLPIGRTYGGGPALAGGAFRLVARGQIHVEGAGLPVEYVLPSRVFTVAR